MTKQQLEILEHALGVNQYGQGPMYRNDYCAGGDDVEVCKELIAMGYMIQHKTTDWLPYFNCSVTREGKKAVIEESPKPPKKTRSQLRMEEYRSFSDCYDCTFREFLDIQKTDWYKDMKNGTARASIFGDYI